MRIHALTLVTALVFASPYAGATDEMAPEGADTSKEMPSDAVTPPDTAEPADEAGAEPEMKPATEMEPKTETEEATDPGSASAGDQTGTVARSSFTTGMLEREPVDRVEVLADDQGEIFFFTELKDLSGQTVVHRWEYGGKVMAEVPFEVKGPRWRVYSRKSLLPEWKGDWTVTVLDGTGDPLDSAQFTYASQTPPTPAPSPASPLGDEEKSEADEKVPPAATAD